MEELEEATDQSLEVVDPLEAEITITLAGETHTLRLGDCNALDAKACRAEVGVSITGLFRRMGEDPDIDDVAAIVWLARRKNGQPKITFAEVAQTIDYGATIDMASNAVEETNDPE